MSWAVGEREGRHIGYGVPAMCDYPGCGEAIDRGLAYACGGGVTGRVENCGLFFCGKHLTHWMDENDPNGGGENVCVRCHLALPPFEPTADTAEWIDHLLTDPSWQRWCEENPERVWAMGSAS